MRVALQETDGFKVVFALEQHVRSKVEPELLELVKLRASFLNGCAHCIDMHSTDGIARGMDPRRLFAVAAWPESAFFDERERAALALTDAVTHIAGGVDDEVWDAAVAAHGTEGATDILLAIGTINLWNRLAIGVHAPSPALV